jgi:hypothetical protein
MCLDDTTGTDVVVDVMLETAASGYNLGVKSVLREANRGITRTDRGWHDYYADLGFQPEDLIHVDQAKVVPRFAAAVAIDLRSRLGQLPYNEANLLLVQRKYLEVCRNRGVHRTDVIVHEQHVINVFFGTKLFERVATVRARLPKWLKWAYDVPDVDRQGPIAC